MVKYFALLLLLAFCCNINAQTKTLPAEAKSFILKGYEMMDYITGDLNGDKKADAILIMRLQGEENLSAEESTRPFVILIREANGKLKQAKRNDNVVMCRQCGGVFGDPYDNTTIANNGFEISFYGGSSWRWGSTFKFAYKAKQNNWYLIKEEQVSFQSGDPEATTKTILIEEPELGEVPLESFNSSPPYADGKWKVTAAKTFFYDNPKLGSKPRKGFLLKDNIATGVRELQHFVELGYNNAKGVFTTGFVLKKDVVKIN